MLNDFMLSHLKSRGRGFSWWGHKRFIANLGD